MPEGPEVRRAADRVAKALIGHPAEQVFFAFPHLKRFEHLLRGEQVAAVETRGKAMLTAFANGLAVYSHNLLYGRWMVRPQGKLPKTRRQLRFAVHNGERSALLYSASELDVVELANAEVHPFLAGLGPDLLDPTLTWRALRERLREPRFRNRQLGALLLDQAFVAGTGNYLRAEMLFEAGLHPARRAVDCSTREQGALARAILAVAQRAYRSGGVTNDPRRVARMRAEGLPRRHWRHHVFARGGRPCWVCERPILRDAVGGRRTYFCPSCQPPGKIV